MGFGPNWGVVSEGGDFFQIEISASCSGRTGEDGVPESLWFDFAGRACQLGVLLEPGGVGGRVALRRSHLVDPCRHQLS